jgi:hypothetical protein
LATNISKAAIKSATAAEITQALIAVPVLKDKISAVIKAFGSEAEKYPKQLEVLHKAARLTPPIQQEALVPKN